MIKKSVLYVFKFFTAIIFFVCLLVLMFGILLSKQNISAIISNIEYKDNISKLIKKEMEDYTASANIPYSILDGIYKEEELNHQIDDNIESFYKNTDPIDTSFIGIRLNNNINDYLNKENIKPENQEDINSFISNIEKIYLNEVNFYSYLDFIKPYTRIVVKILPYILLALIIVEISLIFILKVVFKEKRMLFIAFTSSFLYLFFSIVLLVRIDINNLFIFNDAFSDLLQTVLTKVFIYSFIIGILLLLFGFILGIKLGNNKNIKKDGNLV